MSFLTTGSPRIFIRDLWPYPTVARDPSDPSQCAYWQAVPCVAHELSEWLCLAQNANTRDRTRPFVVVHAVDHSHETMFEVNLRLQGVVRSANVEPLGNWDGTTHGALRAVQRLVLCSNGNDDAWLATLSQLNKLIGLVTRLADRQSDVKTLPEGPTTTLALQRRVFRRSSPGKTDHAARSTARAPVAGEFLSHLAALSSLGADWDVNKPLAFGALRGGDVHRGNVVLLNDGDFVDVMATMEVVQKNKLTRVHFNFDRIIQIQPVEVVIPPTITARRAGNQSYHIVRTSTDDIFHGEDEDFELYDTSDGDGEDN